MSVANGQPVNASVTNAAFVSKTTDSTVVSKVTLDKSGSGTTITDTQAVINKALDAVGTTEADATPNNYSSANFVTNGDNRKVAIGKLDTQLKTTNDNVNSAIASNTSQDTRLTNLESNNMTIAGNKTFSGNTVFSGDVTVNGTTTTINSTTQDVVDPNITVNKGGTNLTSEGAGITVDRAGTKGSIIYKNASATKFAIGDLASEVNIVDESTAQTLSNKNFPYSDYLEQGSDPSAPAATYRRIYSKADGFYQRDSAGVISKVGTGSGSGGAINLVTNGDADSAIATIFVPYQDSSGARPIDGTGGTTTGITTALTATAPLSGTNSFTLTKDAANRQGGGWSAPFTVDLAYRAKSLKISVDYIVNSGTFVSGSSSAESDVIFYLYDVTNSQLIEPSNIKLFASSTSTSDKYEATFQTSATGSSYRLIAHIQSVSALAYELKVDNVSVSPQNYVYSTAITAWTAYTPTFVGFGTATGISFESRQVGEEIEVRGVFTSGTSTAVAASITLPTTAVAVASNTILRGSISRALATATTNKDYTAILTSSSSTLINIGIRENPSSSSASSAETGSNLASSGHVIHVNFTYKAQGLLASVQVSDGYAARDLTFSGTQSSQAVTANSTNIAFTSTKDSASSWSGTQYTVKSAGDYFVIASCLTNGLATLYVKVNGTQVGYLSTTQTAGSNALSGAQLLTNLVAGDTISLVSANSVTLTSGRISISKNQAPTTISVNEEISLRYSNTAGTTVPATVTTYPYAVKSYDTHGAYNTSTGEFTAPVAGRYIVRASVTSTYNAAAYDLNVRFYVNGSSVSYAYKTVQTGSAQQVINNDILNLNAGDILTIRVDQSVSAASSTAVGANVLAIARLK